MEIERKYLVKELPNLRTLQSARIRQAYLFITEDAELRLREINGHYFATMKGRGTYQREEIETQIAPKVFKTLWKHSHGCIVKERYIFPYAGHAIEIDIFKEKHEGLILAEIEFLNLEEYRQFVKPSFLGEDVTEYPQYQNRHLSQNAQP